MKVRHVTKVVIAATVLTACGGSRDDSPDAPQSAASDPGLAVAVVNYPLAYFTERIGGDDVAVVFPVPADVDPADWSPEPEAVTKYQSADLILLNGADYAKWVSRASLPARKLIDTSAAYADRLIPLEDAISHTHGPQGEHAHEGVAFTTWLDLALAGEQARAIAGAFEQARPDQAAAIRERLEKLEADLESLDVRLEAATAALGGQPILFSHPVYQYFERRYGLNGRSVHWEPDAEPSRRQWDEFEKLLAQHQARWMIWEAEPLPAVTERLEELGVSSVVFAPCSNRMEEDDFLQVMQSNLDRLEAAWGETGGADSPIS